MSVYYFCFVYVNHDYKLRFGRKNVRLLRYFKENIHNGFPCLLTASIYEKTFRIFMGLYTVFDKIHNLRHPFIYRITIYTNYSKHVEQNVGAHITGNIANSKYFYASVLSKFNFSEFQIFLTFQKMNLLPLIMSNFLQIKKDNFHRMMFFKLQLILYLMANQRLLIQCVQSQQGIVFRH